MMELERFGVEPAVDEDAVAAELEGFVRGWQPAVDEPEGRPRWQITSLGAADWAMRKLGETAVMVRRYDDEIKLWQAARERLQRAGQFFEEHLKQWAISQRTEAVKTFNLAHGSISTRAGAKPKVVVVDEAAAIAWAKGDGKRPNAVRTVEAFVLAESGARLVEVPAHIDVVDKSTGDHTLVSYDPAVFAEMADHPELVATVVTELRAMTTCDLDCTASPCRHEVPVPGLGVKHAGDVTANVAPTVPM